MSLSLVIASVVIADIALNAVLVLGLWRRRAAAHGDLPSAERTVVIPAAALRTLGSPVSGSRNRHTSTRILGT